MAEFKIHLESLPVEGPLLKYPLAVAQFTVSEIQFPTPSSKKSVKQSAIELIQAASAPDVGPLLKNPVKQLDVDATHSASTPVVGPLLK